jgi:hypothetical protein
MGDVYIRFPVTCPICGAESITAFRVEAIVDGLDKGTPIRLAAKCHDRAWNASQLEVEQIREYLTATIKFTGRDHPWMAQ